MIREIIAGTLVALAWCTVVFFWINMTLSLAKALGRPRPRFWMLLWKIFKWLALPGCFGYLICDAILGVRSGVFEEVVSLVSFVVWLYVRNDHDDDDQEKRLKDKIKGVIARVANKLVVVNPEPA